MQWAYGVITVPSRRFTYFPPSIKSLKAAGFDKPTIFVDGTLNSYDEQDIVYRQGTPIGAWGNWWLSMWELWIRHPEAERYALFEDDVIYCKGLRTYLETQELIPKRYWNLYNVPMNECGHKGERWYPARQHGQGALALVFPREAITELLKAEELVEKPHIQKYRTERVDGSIVDVLTARGIYEFVHYPSLCQHIGNTSSIKVKALRAKPNSFPGEDYSALELFKPSPLGVH